jgi:hypothetical protein
MLPYRGNCIPPFSFSIQNNTWRGIVNIPHPSTTDCLLLLFCVMFDCMVWTLSCGNGPENNIGVSWNAYIRSLCLHTQRVTERKKLFDWCGTTRALKNFHTRAPLYLNDTSYCTCTRLGLSTNCQYVQSFDGTTSFSMLIGIPA